jgi:16S rRNA (guanine966-N2)-methyltransferase
VRLAAPAEGTRPLSDRVKESLFGALESAGVVGDGRSFLDLFAGSGAAGIDALSRGSARAMFVEVDADACRVIEQNLRNARVSGGKVTRSDVARILAGPSERPFDAVLVDPPYESELLGPTLESLGRPDGGWLTPEAIVVAKHFWRDAPGPQIGRLERYRERRFGETMLTFYRYAPAAEI